MIRIVPFQINIVYSLKSQDIYNESIIKYFKSNITKLINTPTHHIRKVNTDIC